MSQPEYFLLVRTYADSKHRGVWVVREDGMAQAGLLHGQLLPHAVEELAKATGLQVVQEESPLGFRPNTPPGCVPAAEQAGLFPV